MDKVPSNGTFTSKCKSQLTKICLFLQNRGGGVVVMLKGFRLMDMDEGQHHTVTVALSHSPSPSGFTCASSPAMSQPRNCTETGVRTGPSTSNKYYVPMVGALAHSQTLGKVAS